MPQRYIIVAITAVAALWMYIDRVCFSILADPIQTDLGVTDEQKSYILGAFFLTYALFQIPMGSLADRFGARLVLTLSIAAWSLVTAATGFATGFVVLLIVRLMLGITEAGAYPAAAGLVKRWARPEERGRFSSVVALGGRIGGAVAPWLTATLAIGLVGYGFTELFPHNPSGKNWRGVFMVYGLCGLAVAVLFWLFVRDHPPVATIPQQPLPQSYRNDDTVPQPQQPPKAPRTLFEQIVLLAHSPNMWLLGGVQFGVNLGWAFLITLLPTYLNDRFGVPLEERGRMQSVALITGCMGMLFGGVATDALRGWLGPRRGRTVPIVGTLGGCAIVFFLAPSLPTAWAVVVALGVMAFFVDLHNPSIWSFAQDVGGKNVGAALGWGNMWGNLGAALSPVLLTAIWKATSWDVVFITCGISFAVAALCGLLLDATKPVDPDDGH